MEAPRGRKLLLYYREAKSQDNSTQKECKNFKLEAPVSVIKFNFMTSNNLVMYVYLF